MKERIVRDPIHDFITLSDYDFVQRLIDTKYFQRLRRLFQLGVSPFVYPTATHNRLSHSLGAMELFGRIFDHLHKNEHAETTTELKKLGIASILLHDIGHGPLSHVSETIFDFKHEDFTIDIIKNTEIKEILAKDGIEADDIAKIIKHTSPPEYKYISQLVSSELDVDRLDYLSRDAFFTGVEFGKIDLQRIIRTLQLYRGGGDLDGYVISSNKGLESIESYVLGRYLMYQGVYYHKTTRGIEGLIRHVFKRAVVLSKNNKLNLPTEFEFLINSTEFSLNDLVELDDYVVYNLIKQWTKSDDAVLKELAVRIIDRKPLKHIETSKMMDYANNIDAIKDELKKQNFDPDYHLIYDQPTVTPYSPYSPQSADDQTSVITNIFVLDKNNEPKEISHLSDVVQTLSKVQSNFRFYIPEECLSPTLSILGMKGN